MKIALLSWESLHSIAVGGVARHVTELGAALQRRGHDVHVFVRIGHGQKNYEVIDGVHYHRCPIQIHPDFITEMNNMCNAFMWFLGEIEAKEGPFDLIHGHDWLCAKGVVQAKNDRGRRTVMTLHSTEFGRCGNVNHKGRSERARAFEAEGAYCADRVITVSGVLADEVKSQYQVPDWKLRTVRNGVECHRFDIDVDAAEVRRQYAVGPMDPAFLFVGRLEYQKGPDLLLETMPGVLRTRGDAKFIFAGEGQMRSQLERRAHQLGVAHAIRFTGQLSGEQPLIRLFKSCDAVCVPSRNEPFGIVILEAWASRKPVIATHNGGPRETIQHGETGYLVYDRPDSISWGIHQVLHDFCGARRMGERGRNAAETGYSWDHIAAQTEEVYYELVPHPKATAVVRPSRIIRSVVSSVKEASIELEYAAAAAKRKGARDENQEIMPDSLA